MGDAIVTLSGDTHNRRAEVIDMSALCVDDWLHRSVSPQLTPGADIWNPTPPRRSPARRRRHRSSAARANCLRPRVPTARQSFVVQVDPCNPCHRRLERRNDSSMTAVRDESVSRPQSPATLNIRFRTEFDTKCRAYGQSLGIRAGSRRGPMSAVSQTARGAVTCIFAILVKTMTSCVNPTQIDGFRSQDERSHEFHGNVLTDTRPRRLLVMS